jgi:hypothetical protein
MMPFSNLPFVSGFVAAMLLRIALLYVNKPWHSLVSVVSWVFSPTVLADLGLRAVGVSQFSSYAAFWVWATVLALLNGYCYSWIHSWIRSEIVTTKRGGFGTV